MNNKKAPSEVMILHKDNPFKDDVRSMLSSTREVNKTLNAQGQLAREEITITYRKEYLPFGFTKMYQNKELLKDLSPWACKILIYIALNLQYNQQKIKLTYKLVGLDERKYSTTMLELMLKRIIVKEKPGWYWVNVTLLIVGYINTHETIKS